MPSVLSNRALRIAGATARLFHHFPGRPDSAACVSLPRNYSTDFLKIYSLNENKKSQSHLTRAPVSNEIGRVGDQNTNYDLDRPIVHPPLEPRDHATDCQADQNAASGVGRLIFFTYLAQQRDQASAPLTAN